MVRDKDRKKSLKETKLNFRFELIKEKRVIQTLPGFGELECDLNTDYDKNWFI